MGGADTRAGQHGNGQFWDHGHIDGDPVTLLNTQALQSVGKLADLSIKIPVGVDAPVARFALPNDCRLVAAAGGQVSVQTIVGNV